MNGSPDRRSPVAVVRHSVGVLHTEAPRFFTVLIVTVYGKYCGRKLFRVRRKQILKGERLFVDIVRRCDDVTRVLSASYGVQVSIFMCLKRQRRLVPPLRCRGDESGGQFLQDPALFSQELVMLLTVSHSPPNGPSSAASARRGT